MTSSPECPCRVHLTLALTEAKIARITQISNPDGDFAVPGFGYCELKNWSPQSLKSGNVFFGCRVALGTPLTEMASQWIYRPCSAKASADADEEKKLSYGWVGTEGVLQREMALVPILTQNFGFAGISNDNSVAMCPNRPGVVTFTQYVPSRRLLVTVNAQDFHLSFKPATD